MMRSASRQALSVLQGQEDTVFGGSDHSGISAHTLSDLAGELYAVGTLLARSPQLRRALGDPATRADERVGLAENLFRGKISKHALDLLSTAVRERWSSPWDLSDAVEGAGDDALFSAAEKDGALDRVEDELFRLERILQVEGEVAGLLDEQSVEPERRLSLLDSLVEGKVSPVTLAMLHHAVTSDRKRSIGLAVDDLLEKAAERQERSIARVVSAVPLTDAQEDRLAAALTKMYGRGIVVRTALDPSVQGGLIIRVGGEVIDGSIATRFASARTAMGA